LSRFKADISVFGSQVADWIRLQTHFLPYLSRETELKRMKIFTTWQPFWREIDYEIICKIIFAY
jgi:hypothetical protein